jgi:riboflavin biosynthesis pyrimidine reductase
MDKVHGPGSAFELLFAESASEGISLPADLQRIYGSDWLIPAGAQTYVYVNFAISRDGRVSFDEPGHRGGGDVSGFNTHDRWLMGLLRARADAVLMGDNTLRVESEHIWTAEYIFPADAAIFAALRVREQRRPTPHQVFLSQTGDLPWDAEVFSRPELSIVIATTHQGAERIRADHPDGGRFEVLDLGNATCDLAELVRVLAQRYGVRTLLCEGGPRVYGSMLAAGQVDEEFVTLCPVVIGNRADGAARPSLVEGVPFPPGAAPRPRPVSLRRAGDHLFLRSTFR